MEKKVIIINIGLFFTLLVLGSCSQQPSKAAQRRQQKYEKDSLAWVAQQKSLTYYQTTFDSLQLIAKTILNDHFCYEKNNQYEDHGHYVHRRLRTSSNAERNYVQTYVTDDFQILVKIYTVSTRPLHPREASLAAGELYNTFTGSSHSFEQEGWHTIFTLTGEEAIAALRFIDLYRTQPITVRLKEEKNTRTFRLSERDQQALLDTYQLGCVMQDIHQLEKRINQTHLEIQKYEHRIHNRA